LLAVVDAWLITLCARWFALPTAVDAWLSTLFTCELTLLIALLTLAELLSDPHPVAATPAMPSTVAAAAATASRVNLLDCLAMRPLLLPGGFGGTGLARQLY
jgi:hypothetical protein